MHPQTQHHDAIQAARAMMDRYGLRASAIAAERIAEAQVSGQTDRLDHWRQVAMAIAELGRTRAKAH